MIKTYVLFLLNRFKGYIFTNLLIIGCYYIFMSFILPLIPQLYFSNEPDDLYYPDRMRFIYLLSIVAYLLFNLLYSRIYLHAYQDKFVSPTKGICIDAREDYVLRHSEPFRFRDDLVSHMQEQGWFELAAYGVFCLITLLVMQLPVGGIFNPIKAFLGMLNFIAIINYDHIPLVPGILLAWFFFSLNYIITVPLIHRRWRRLWKK